MVDIGTGLEIEIEGDKVRASYKTWWNLYKARGSRGTVRILGIDHESNGICSAITYPADDEPVTVGESEMYLASQ